MKYLIDTNILIFLCNSKSKILENKFKTRNPEEFSVSSITVGELIYGVNKSQHRDRNLQAILKILSPFKIIDFDSSDGLTDPPQNDRSVRLNLTDESGSK